MKLMGEVEQEAAGAWELIAQRLCCETPCGSGAWGLGLHTRKESCQVSNPHISPGNCQLKPLSLRALPVQLECPNKEAPLTAGWPPTAGLPLNKAQLADPTGLRSYETQRWRKKKLGFGILSPDHDMDMLCGLGWPFNLSEPMKRGW